MNAKEIEREFLINKDAWTPQDAGTHFKQGYLNAQKERVVRVRIEGSEADHQRCDYRRHALRI